jgi:hypothetical protein
VSIKPRGRFSRVDSPAFGGDVEVGRSVDKV